MVARRTRLAEARRRAHLTQVQLAEILGISRLGLIAIEVGRRNPGMDLMLRWVRALGVYGSTDLFDPELDAPTPRRRRAA